MELQENELERYYYQIEVSGHLDEGWSAWLDCSTIIRKTTQDNQMPVTLLTFPVADQPALRGFLNRLFDLNLTLLSVVRCNPDSFTNEIRETEK